MDSSVSLKISIITRESTITREIRAKIDNSSTEHIHYTGVRSQEVRKPTLLNSGKRLENSNVYREI